MPAPTRGRPTAAAPARPTLEALRARLTAAMNCALGFLPFCDAAAGLTRDYSGPSPASGEANRRGGRAFYSAMPGGDSAKLRSRLLMGTHLPAACREAGLVDQCRAAAERCALSQECASWLTRELVP